MRGIQIIVTFLCLISIILQTVHADFSPASYGLDDVPGYIAAVGDVNNDKHTDLFIVDYNTTQKIYTITIYIWNSKAKTFIPLPQPITTQKSIANIITADFDYDGKLDILVTGPTNPDDNEHGKVGQYYVDFYLGKHFSTFDDISPHPKTQPDASIDDQSLPIGQVSAIDVNGDMKIDLYGMTVNSNGEYRRTLWINTGSDPLKYEIEFQDLPSSVGSAVYLSMAHAPLLADVNGDCISDLILVTTNRPPNASPREEDTLQIELWVFVKRPANEKTSSSYFEFHSANPLVKGAQQPIVGDFNSDGANDILIPSCYPYDSCKESNDIHIWFNIQRKMCSSPLSTGSGCRKQQDLCTKDDDFTFGDFKQSIENPSYLSIAKDVLFPNEHFYRPSQDIPYSYYNPPFSIRIGDINLDGNTDLLLPLVSNDTGHTRFAAFTMTPCSQGASRCSDLSKDNGHYTVTPLDAGGLPKYTTTTPTKNDKHDIAVISQSHVIFSSVLVDLGNTGSLDLLLLHYPKTTSDQVTPSTQSKQKRSISSVFTDLVSMLLPSSLSSNNHQDNQPPSHDNHGSQDTDTTMIEHRHTATTDSRMMSPPPSHGVITVYTNEFREDAYFLTLLTNNGVCDAWCSSGPKFPSPKPYGSHLIGATFKFTVTELNGRKSPRISQQIPSTSHLGLHTPQQVLGLGRTNNYIEEVFLGVPNPQGSHSNLWVAMIPNSQIVIFPHPPRSPSEWNIELFISPTQRLIWVTIAFVSTLIVCAITILVLHLREKEQEKKAKGQRQHLFAF